MKTKTLSLSMAAIMSLQSIGYANTDRTEGIGVQAIANAQENIAAIQSNIDGLDKSLEVAAQAIEKRDGRGGITNTIAVAGATAGVLLTTAAYFTVRKRVEGAGLGALMFGALSVGTTVVSVVSGLTSQGLKTSVDTKELEAQLDETQKNIETAVTQTQDKSTAAILMQLNSSVKNAQIALKEYQEDKNSETITRLSAQGTQIAGIAMSAFGLTQRNSSLVLLGPAIMSVGNIVAGFAGLSSEQADVVLKEIAQTRESLKIAKAALK